MTRFQLGKTRFGYILSQLGFDFDAAPHLDEQQERAERIVTPTAVVSPPRKIEIAGEFFGRGLVLDDTPTVKINTEAQPKKSRGAAAVRARTAVLFSRLQELGLRGIEKLVLVRTRTVMVSLIGRTLRVHEGYAEASEGVLRAIVTFATARNKAVRTTARDAILAHDVERAPAARRAEPARAGDAALISALATAHVELNTRWFHNELSSLPIRLSSRMATRLGHFDPGSRLTPSEIVMSRKHIVRHGWKEATHTLLHEMVHQWQHETGRPVDHHGSFRKKCREVGIVPSARREVVPLKARQVHSA